MRRAEAGSRERSRSCRHGADRMPGRAANTGGAAGWGTARRLDCQRAAVGTGGCRGHRRRTGGRRTSALLRRVAGVRNVRQRKRAASARAEAPWNTWVRTRSAPRIWIVTRFRPAHPVSGGMRRTPARPHHARVVRRRPSSAQDYDMVVATTAPAAEICRDRHPMRPSFPVREGRR